MALAIVLPLLHTGAPVRDLRIGSPLVLRGDATAPAGQEHGVSFRLNRAGYPVLIHIDGAGTARLIHPAAGDTPARFEKGRLVLLPPSGSSAWREGLAPGDETYLLAVAVKGPPDSDLLRTWPAAASRTRGESIRAAEARLVQIAGPVSRIDDSNRD